jgi:AraC-like DNA-binding protein
MLAGMPCACGLRKKRIDYGVPMPQVWHRKGTVMEHRVIEKTGYHFNVMRRAIAEIDAAGPAPLSLEDLAGRLKMSPAHFQRIFSRWVGVSPKRYQQYLTLDHARALLAERFTTLDAANELGLSGTGRLHDLFLKWEAMSPGEYARKGAGLKVRYGWFDSPFGRLLAMGTDRGLCGMAFAEETGDEAAYADMTARWPEAGFAEAPDAIRDWVEGAFGTGGAQLPGQGLGGAAGDPIRPCYNLFRDCQCHRKPARRARCRHRSGAKPCQLADPLPPGIAQIRRAGGLSLGPARQARHAGLGKRAGRRRGLAVTARTCRTRPIGPVMRVDIE